MLKKYFTNFSSVTGLVAMLTVAVAAPAFAQTTPTPPAPNSAWTGKVGGMHGRGMGGMMKPGVFGMVSAVNGNTITVAAKKGFDANTTTAATTYTVDATNAKVMKAGAASTVSAIAVGDTIMAEGTLTGTNLVATNIRDGLMGGMHGAPGIDQEKPMTPPITGNGQPIVGGTVSAVNGSTITITNKSNVSYSIDASNAKISQGPNTITLSTVKVGDAVIAQGTINGNAVVAASVIDQPKPAAPAAGSTTPPPHKGFFAGIGSFFSTLFGF